MGFKMTSEYQWEIFRCTTCDYHFAILMHFADEEMPESCPICQTKEAIFIGVSGDSLNVKGGLTNA